MLSCRFGVEMEMSPYIYPPFKIAMSQSNGLRMKNVVKLRILDVSWSSGVFAMELHCKFWCRDFRSRLPEIVFVVVSLLLNEALESSPVPTTVEHLFLILSVNSLTVSRAEGFCWGSKPMQGSCPVSRRNGGC